ncbi:MAG: acyl carrier protein [Candidatus Xenobia bacterium]
MMSREDILSHTRALMARHLLIVPTDLPPETRLESLGLDSLATRELIMEVEEFFNVDIRHAELGHLETLDDLVGQIHQTLLARVEPNPSEGE